MIIFVSYSSTNREAVEALVLQLGELGHDVEYELKFIGAPITWRHVFSSITNCDLFITAVTRETLVSSTCDIEYQYARSLNKNILAVLLEDLSTEDLPQMKVKGLVDFRVNTPETQFVLAEAIAALPDSVPPPNMLIPSANWVSPLAELRKRIENLPRDAKEQRAVGLNVKEFLERRESFEVARSLLELLAVQPGLRQTTLGEIEYIRGELWRVRALTQGARRRRTLVGAIVLSSLVALVAVILSQLFFRFRANYNVELSLTRTADASNITAADVISSASAMPLSATATLVSTTVLSTPRDNQSESADDSGFTATVLLATNTPAAPSLTATPIPATLTLRATQIPPTQTLVIPSSPTPIAPTPTVLPAAAQGVAFMPTRSTTADGIAAVRPTRYVGLMVEDTPLGLKVSNVGAVAQAAGVQIGDYILAVDLEIVPTRVMFLEVMQSRSPFSEITLRVRRADSINAITFVLGVSDFALATPTP